jgi:hypothetical protein
VLQQLDLAQGALGENLLAEHIGDLLDSHSLVRLTVYCSTVVVLLPMGSLSLAKRISMMVAGSFKIARHMRGAKRATGLEECWKLTRQYRRLPGRAPW